MPDDISGGFPSDALKLIRCPSDSGELASEQTGRIVDGIARCRTCGRAVPITGGVLDLLDTASLHPESSRERELRDQEWQTAPAKLTDYDRAEMDPTIEALKIRPGYRLLEFGAGTGRYTAVLAPRCDLIVAVDFSLQGLLTLSRRIPGAALALVRADVAKFSVAPQSFDGVLSTLTSNLPDSEHRRKLYKVSAAALTGNGSFVSGTHYYGARARQARLQKEGNYEGTGIFRTYTTKEDVLPEIAPYFGDIQMRPVQIVPPLARTLRIPLLRFSRFAEHIPGVREFGGILMTVARQPVRSAS